MSDQIANAGGSEPAKPGLLERVVRRIPIDTKAIVLQSGMRRGKLCHSPIFGWVVQNTSGNPEWPDMAGITPPEMMAGETRISIVDGHWCFHAPNAQRERPAEGGGR